MIAEVIGGPLDGARIHLTPDPKDWSTARNGQRVFLFRRCIRGRPVLLDCGIDPDMSEHTDFSFEDE